MYAMMEGTVGTPQPVDVQVPDTNQRFPLGQIVSGVDPYFGFGEFVYAKAGGSNIAVGRVSYIPDQTYVVADMPNTANLGRNLVVPACAMLASTFGWFCMRGLRPWSASASVAAGVAFGIAAAGQVGANSAGKQVLNAQVAQASTFAPTKANCATINGSNQLQVPNIDGLFIGLAVSGTGIPGGTTITAMNPNQSFVTLSANATASGVLTATFTWTGFLMVWAGGAFTQGAIT